MAEPGGPAWSDREVRCGDLAGTLTLPRGEGPFAAALIVPGSGPVDRDGNLPGMASNFLALLAQDLALRGIASLRFDKRGVGGSRSAALREEDLRFGHMVDDATVWLACLRAAAPVKSLSLIGHSEGALVATMAAHRTEIDGLVLICGAGFPAGEIILRQLQDAAVADQVRADARRILDQLARGRRAEDVPAGLEALFRDSVQPYLMSWLPLDPARELGLVTCPALVVQGETDLQVGVADARRLAGSLAGARLVLVPGMNHVLKSAPLEREANFAAYGDAAAPLAPGLVEAVSDFILRTG